MRRRTIAITIALSALAPLTAAPAAPAASTKAKKPKVTRVTPMRVKVGQKLVIRGRNFSKKRRRNTVVFKSADGRAAFAKPRKASRRKLVLKVPAAVSRILRNKKTSRFKLRVLVRKRFSRWTKKRLSPVIVSTAGRSIGDGGGGSVSCPNDNDLLSKSRELELKLDPCLDDTDGDGVDDGYEVQSAIDLNHDPRTTPLPYPGKRPYPNALDPSDRSTDYDGDSMTLKEEFQMWVRFSADGVRRSGYPGTLDNLLYSDGLQKSIDPAPVAPSGALANWALDLDENGRLWDDERDVDNDGLSNYTEAHGQMLETWWPATHNGKDDPKESVYPGINFLDRKEVPDIFLDRDADGDGVRDGSDDYDHDGLSNQFEVRRPGNWFTQLFPPDPADDPDPWVYVNPFNPCKPFNSERCHKHPPFGHYDSDEVPPIGPQRSSYPSTPAIPDDPSLGG